MLDLVVFSPEKNQAKRQREERKGWVKSEVTDISSSS